MTELEARIYVASTKCFYRDILAYCAVNVVFFLIWLLAGAGYFWPFWVMFGWGIGLFVQAFTLKLIPRVDQLQKYFPFLNNQWEKEQLRKLMEQSEFKK